MHLSAKEPSGGPEIGQGDQEAHAIRGCLERVYQGGQCLREGKEVLPLHSGEQRWSVEGLLFRCSKKALARHGRQPVCLAAIILRSVLLGDQMLGSRNFTYLCWVLPDFARMRPLPQLPAAVGGRGGRGEGSGGRITGKRASCGSSEVITLAKTPRNKELQRCKRQKCSSVPWTLS